VSRLAPLRNQPFRRLGGAYAISRIGDMLAIVALAVIVYDRTRSTYATTALFIALEFLPALVGPGLAARVDRLPVGRLLPILYLVEAALFAALAALTHSFTLVPFLALVALDGVLGVVARAVCRGAVAGVLEPAGELREGMALLNLAVAPSMAIGGVVGAALVTGLSADIALLVNAGSFAFGALLVGTARALPRLSAEDDDVGEGWRERLAATVRYVRGRRLVSALLVGQAAALVFFAMTEPIEVAYTRDALGAGAGGYGALIAAWGAGVVAGSVLYTWVGSSRLAATALVSTALQGVAYLALAGVGTIELACAVAVVGGAANGAQLVAIGTALQEAIEPEQQVRVMSVYEALSTASPGVGYLLGGAVAAAAGGRAAFAVAGAGVLVVLAAVVVARPWAGLPARERVGSVA
jgi:MFS family permease